MERNPSVIERAVSAFLGGAIRAYQYAVSPLFPPSCRFFPSCSDYALEAVKIHGAWRGGFMAAKRICRCNPWNAGGIDLVPGSRFETTESNRS